MSRLPSPRLLMLSILLAHMPCPGCGGHHHHGRSKPVDWARYDKARKAQQAQEQAKEQAHEHGHADHEHEAGPTPDRGARPQLSERAERMRSLPGYCPVSGTKGDPDISVDLGGSSVCFCSASCKRMFLDDPEAYMDAVDAQLEARK